MIKAKLDTVEARGTELPRKAVENNHSWFFSPQQKIDKLCRADVQGQEFGHSFEALAVVC